jgi:hypothetical protein
MASKVLATYPSNSNPGKVHTVSEDDQGVIWCSCPGWRLHQRTDGSRTCKHLQEYGATALQAGLKARGINTTKKTDLEMITDKVIEELRGALVR